MACSRSLNNSFECGPCPDQLTGDGIDCQNIDACATRKPCFNGVECFPLGDTEFVCGPCPSRMTGDGQTCVQMPDKVSVDRQNVCRNDATNPCFEKSMCRVTNDGNVTCVACPKGFKGDGVKCTRVNNDASLCSGKKNLCFPGSKCDVVNGIVTCGPCPEGLLFDKNNY